MNDVTAYDRIASMVDAFAEPVLSGDELATLVTVAKRADAAGNPVTNTADAPVWAASTRYYYGDVVTADPTAGRFWLCTVPGVSGTVQPTWPTRERIAPFQTTVTEDDVIWIDAGNMWNPTYDLNAAAAEGWRLKAGKVAARYDFTTDGQTFRRGSQLAHCQQMERMYRRRIARVA